MIAELTINGMTATMDGKEWHSNDQLLQDHLRVRFPLTSSPADGQPGAKQVAEASEKLHAKVRWIGVQPEVPDRVY